MNTDLFVKAKIICKYLQILDETDKMVDAEFAKTGIKTRVWKENNQLKSSCTCKQFSINTCDCSHVLALKYYLIKNSNPDEIDVRIL